MCKYPKDYFNVHKYIFLNTGHKDKTHVGYCALCNFIDEHLKCNILYQNFSILTLRPAIELYEYSSLKLFFFLRKCICIQYKSIKKAQT